MSPRHEASRFSGENLVGHARLFGPLRESITADARGWRNPDQRQRLYILSEAIRRWASRFNSKNVLPLAASTVSVDSLRRFLRRVAEWCNECEPRTWGGASARASTHPEVLQLLQELEQALTAIQLLPEFATGREVFYPLDPRKPMADNNLGMDLEPPDDETDLYLRTMLQTSLGSADLSTRPDHLLGLEESLRSLATKSVDYLQLVMDTPVHEKGGLGLEAIDLAVLKQPTDCPKVEIHEEMKQVLQDLKELAHGEDAKSATPRMWLESVGRLLACWHPWADECLVLHGLEGNTKQAKKDRLERWVACVSQYAFVMQGVENFARERFVHAVLCLGTLVRRIQKLLKEIDRLPDELPAGAEAEVQSIINELDRLVVDDGVLDRWRTHFGKETQTVGKTVDVIVTAGDGQDEPWQQGAKRHFVDETGLLAGAKTPRARARRFEKRLYRMQQIAVAVQIPHDLLAGKPMRPKHKGEKLHAAEDWLVNPLAAVLANEPVPGPASKAARPTKRRKRATAKKKKPNK